MNKRFFVPLLIVIATTLGACSSSDDSTSRVNAEVIASSMIIDVRTPEEYAAGHLEGATLIDGSYIIYCRSGNRSAQAVERLKAAGFTNLTDLGSLENASEETGIAIVK